jgi:hypothetical protein
LGVVVVGFGCLAWLRGLSFGFWDLDEVIVVVLFGLTAVLLVVGGEEEAAADFLLCKGGLVEAVLAFALFRTDGALTCRDSLAGRDLGVVLTLDLAPAAAVEGPLPDETTPLTGCFDNPISGLVSRLLVLDSAPEFSLSAFRRAGFFRRLLVVVGSDC